MSSVMPVGAGALLRHPSFLLFLLSRSLSRFSSQIGAVAIGWQIYALTGSAFDLGMVGLVQFLPTALFLFVAGNAADRYERKRVMQLCQLAEALTALFLAWGAYSGSLTVAHIFMASFVLGTAGAFESPTTAALLPLITPPGSLQRATAISSGAAELATITGPARGGLAYLLTPSMPFGARAHSRDSSQGAPVARSSHPVRDASDSSVAGWPPSRRTTHSAMLYRRTAARVCGAFSCSQRCLVRLHCVHSGSPVRSEKRAPPSCVSRSASWAVSRLSCQAITGASGLSSAPTRTPASAMLATPSSTIADNFT